jgi:hypothetical protein
LNQFAARATNELGATTVGDRIAPQQRGGSKGRIMHMQSSLWRDYDLGSLTLLMIGISSVALLALSGF